MHNRVRMITASFLIKHLLIDWREGERWFWDTLVDADYGNNSVNWQWVAGTGIDANMFIRIMAPLTQSEKFDAADYIRAMGARTGRICRTPTSTIRPTTARGDYPVQDRRPSRRPRTGAWRRLPSVGEARDIGSRHGIAGATSRPRRSRVRDRRGVLGRLVAPAFARVLDRIDERLELGGIEATLPDGSKRRIGFRAPGPVAIVHLHSWMPLVRLATSGSVGWYKAWAEGEWSSPDPVPLFELFMANAVALGDVARAKGPMRLVNAMAHRLRDKRRARRAQQHRRALRPRQ